MSLNIPRRLRGERLFVFTDLKSCDGAEAVVRWLRTQLEAPPDSRRTVIDARAPCEGRPHTHPHTH